MRPALAAFLALLVSACGEASLPVPDLETRLRALVDASPHEVAVYYRDLGGDGVVRINADVRMHAASTMKIPVLIQLVLDHEAGRRSLSDRVVVTDRFQSIVDGSEYVLDPSSDSDSSLYARLGEPVEVGELAELMITVSSNLATNLLVREVGAQRIMRTLRSMGVDSMEVLRGVEDIPAFEAGLNNTTTARDLGVVLSALATGSVGGPEASQEIVAILSRQQFRDMIPAGLPPGTRVASKDGWITGIRHDAAIVYPDGHSPYVLVVLTRGVEDASEAEGTAARISEIVYRHHTATEPDPRSSSPS